MTEAWPLIPQEHSAKKPKLSSKKDTPSKPRRIISNCTICDLQLKTRKSYISHIIEMHMPRLLQCKDCNEEFIDRWDLSEHCVIYHEHALCYVCGKSFSHQYAIDHHICKTLEYRYKMTPEMAESFKNQNKEYNKDYWINRHLFIEFLLEKCDHLIKNTQDILDYLVECVYYKESIPNSEIIHNKKP